MEWTDTSETRPGYTIWEADDADRPGNHYAIQRNNEMSSQWRLAYRENDEDILRVIYVGNTLNECRTYADTYRNRLPK